MVCVERNTHRRTRTHEMEGCSCSRPEAYDADLVNRTAPFEVLLSDQMHPYRYFCIGHGVWDPKTEITYHLARGRDGFRFASYDSFEADPSIPAALHKYLYVTSSPIIGLDPSGNWGLAETLIVGGAYVLLGALLATFAVPVLRNASAFQVSPGTFVPVTNAYLTGVYHSIKLRNSSLTADQLFAAMSQLSKRNLYPVRALGDVTGTGVDVGFDMRGYFLEAGQGDFSVRVTQYNPSQRYFVVRTLSGHPLAGWRRWEVKQLPNGDLVVDTFSVDHPFNSIDSAKMLLGGEGAQKHTWTNMLWDLSQFSGGQVIYDSDTQLEGKQFAPTEIPARRLMVEGGVGEQ